MASARESPRPTPRGLFKLMAYKDEYEVARLHLDAVERARLEDQFGSGIRVQTLLTPAVLATSGRAAQAQARSLRDPAVRDAQIGAAASRDSA